MGSKWKMGGEQNQAAMRNEDDVEGHLRRARNTEDDTEGQLRRARNTEDDVEGHKRSDDVEGHKRNSEDDDVEGHKRFLRNEERSRRAIKSSTAAIPPKRQPAKALPSSSPWRAA